MTDAAHEEYVLCRDGSAWRVLVNYDEFQSIEDVINDEPCMVFCHDRRDNLNLCRDQSKAMNRTADFYVQITDEDEDAALAFLLEDEFSDEYDDDFGDWPDEVEAKALIRLHFLRARYKRTTYTSGCYRDCQYTVIWDQEEFDAYCGTPDQKPGEALQHYLDGEFYSYAVDPVVWATDPEDLTDVGESIVLENSEDSESCYGFVGDEDYCLQEAKAGMDVVHTFTSLQKLLDYIEGDDTPEG